MTTFKTFLSNILCEGGNATAKWKTQRASKTDIVRALEQVSEWTKIPVKELTNNLLGSTTLTLIGKKADSGDIDVALELAEYNPQEISEKILKNNGNEGHWNAGTKVGSFAIPVGDKKVQVDLMFVDNLDWAKFAFFSSEGHQSKYKGAVRNILMMAVAKDKIVPGEDVVVTDENGNVIARASRSFKLDTGLERLFKIAPAKKTGTGRVKNLIKVSPEELQAELEKIDPKYKKMKFSKSADIINNPDDVAAYLFGAGTKAKDILTTEQIIQLISKKFSVEEQTRIFDEARKTLKDMGLNVPKEVS